MPIAANELKSLLLQFFPESEIILKDLVGDGDHYEVLIKSTKFNGKSRIEQHRMVNEALKGYLGETLHALAIKTMPLE